MIGSNWVMVRRVLGTALRGAVCASVLCLLLAAPACNIDTGASHKTNSLDPRAAALPAPPPDPRAQVPQIATGLLQRQIMIMRLGEGPDEAARSARMAELMTFDFASLPSPEREDLGSCRDSLEKLLLTRRDASAQLGKAIADSMMGCMPVLVDIEFDSRTPPREVTPDLAKAFDAELGLVKTLYFVRAGYGEPPLKQYRPAARAFLEYFVVYTALFGATGRSVAAQAALLAIRTDAIVDPSEQSQFQEIRESLLALSRATSRQDSDLPSYKVRPLLPMMKTLSACQITNQQIRQAGGADAIPTIAAMRKLME